MSKAEFEEVSGVDAAEAMSGEALGSDISSQLGSVSEDTILHVYIVFDADTSIDAGVAAIEEKVLEGNSLEVTRKDATGNAVVAIVTEKQRKAIAELDEVKSVKINEEEGTEASAKQRASMKGGSCNQRRRRKRSSSLVPKNNNGSS